MKNETIDGQKYVETKWSVSYKIHYGSQEYVKEAFVFLGLTSDHPHPRPDKDEEQWAWNEAPNIIAKIERNWNWEIINVNYVCTL